MQSRAMVLVLLLAACDESAAPRDAKGPTTPDRDATAVRPIDAAARPPADAAVRRPDAAVAKKPTGPLSQMVEGGLVAVGVHSNAPAKVHQHYKKAMGDTAWLEVDEAVRRIQGVRGDQATYPKDHMAAGTYLDVWAVDKTNVSYIQGTTGIEFRGELGFVPPCWVTIDAVTPGKPRQYWAAVRDDGKRLTFAGSSGIWRSGKTTFICAVGGSGFIDFAAVVPDAGGCQAFGRTGAKTLVEGTCERKKTRKGIEITVPKQAPITFKVRGKVAQIVKSVPTSKSKSFRDLSAARKAVEKWRKGHKEYLQPRPRIYKPKDVK